MNEAIIQTTWATHFIALDTHYRWLFYNDCLLQMPSPATDPACHFYWKDNQLSIHVKQDCTLRTPLYLIYLGGSETSLKETTRTLQITSEENSHSSIIELFLTQDKHPSHIQNKTEFTLHKGATLSHYRFAHSFCLGTLFANLTVHQSEHSEYQGFIAALGHAEHHSTIVFELNGRHASTRFNTLMLPRERQKSTLQLLVSHHAAECQSQITARGVLHHQARNTFIGKIKVHPNASQTKARLENKNLVLSNEAQAITQPLLEIYNDNVQCAHGATVGHLDDQALFYLRSRGIAESEAKKMLIGGFIQPMIQNILNAQVRSHIEARVHAD